MALIETQFRSTRFETSRPRAFGLSSEIHMQFPWPGGWNGWRDFVVEQVVDESSIIRSFTLVPVDGGTVVRHKPGQYLGFALDLPGIGKLRRNYSLPCAPNARAYRITVKRETARGVPPGAASNWLHDHALPGTVLRVAAPAGDFFLDTEADGP